MILVYYDKGVDPLSAKQLIKAFREMGHEVGRFNHKTTEFNADLLVMPGGLDVWYHNNLKGEGCQRIRQFVEDGGTYLGICAGAYFAAKFVDFERGHSHAIVAERELQFFPGRAEGPALGLGTFDPTSRKGAQMTQIVWEERKLHVFYNGGCRFIDADAEVLARFTDGSPVIIRQKVGKGQAVLCGVHPEYSAKWVGKSDPHLNALLPELEQAEEDRQFLFTELTLPLL